MEPHMHGFSAHISYLHKNHKPDISRGFCTNRDRLSFHAEFQIIFWRDSVQYI